MKKVAILGFGSMGRVHYDVWRKVRGAKVAAVCVRNPAHLTEHARAYGRVDVAAGVALAPDVAVYTDLAQLLAETKPDIVDVTLPTRFHEGATVAALNQGADVLCEKPMALDAKGADRMIAAARQTGRRLMIAQCLRFAPEYAYLKQCVEKRRFGNVVAANFTRLTAAPCTNAGGDSWFFDESLSGGLALDLNIHDADVVRWLFGSPRAVTCRAHRRAGGGVDHLLVDYAYPNAVVSAEASWAAAGSFAFQFGYRVIFENATVVYDPWRKDPLLVYPEKGNPFVPKLKPVNCYDEQIRRFFAWACGRTAAAPVANEDIRASVALVDAERKSAALGRAVEVKA